MATVIIQKRNGKHRNSYIVRYKDPLTGKSKYYKTYQRQKDAQKAANELRSLIDTGKLSGMRGNTPKLNLLTFQEISESLRSKWKNRLECGKLRKKTYDEYIVRLNVLDRTFGKELLCEMTEDEILDYQKEILLKFSAVTSNRSLFVIKQVFKHGLELKATIHDPSEKIKYLSEKQHERNKFLLPAEVQKLVVASMMTRAKFYLPTLIYLGAEHGASKQEALSLLWSDIDFTYNGHGIIRFFRTKNGKERTECLMPRTKDALLRWKDHQKLLHKRYRITQVKTDLVFCRADGSPIREFKKAWHSACQIGGFHDLHFHDLRHTFCSNLVLSGADLKNVKEMIGHRDISMTDRYTHLTINHKRVWQDRLAQHYCAGVLD